MTTEQVADQAKTLFPHSDRVYVQDAKHEWHVRVYEKYSHDELELIAKYAVPKG